MTARASNSAAGTAIRSPLPKGQLPPVKGFWSLTLYNEVHFFNPNPLKRYSLGTKNKNLKYNADGSLTLYAGAKSPGKDKESNWLPAPERRRSRSTSVPIGRTRAILDGTWQPPLIEEEATTGRGDQIGPMSVVGPSRKLAPADIHGGIS